MRSCLSKFCVLSSSVIVFSILSVFGLMLVSELGLPVLLWSFPCESFACTNEAEVFHMVMVAPSLRLSSIELT